MGNDIIGDDGVGLVASRNLKNEFENVIDFVELCGGGLDLLDILEGYKKALIIDSITTGKNIPGSILEFSVEDFRNVMISSPHSAGLPEVFFLAQQLNISFPEELKILAIEIEKQFEIREGLSPSIAAFLPSLQERAKNILAEWLKISIC